MLIDDATQKKTFKMSCFKKSCSQDAERKAQVMSQNTFMSQHDIHTQVILRLDFPFFNYFFKADLVTSVSRRRKTKTLDEIEHFMIALILLKRCGMNANVLCVDIVIRKSDCIL